MNNVTYGHNKVLFSEYITIFYILSILVYIQN